LGADPTQIVGDLDGYFMPAAGKVGVFNGYTGRSRPRMREDSVGDVEAEKSISDTKSVDRNPCIGCGLKTDTDSDR